MSIISQKKCYELVMLQLQRKCVFSSVLLCKFRAYAVRMLSSILWLFYSPEVCGPLMTDLVKPTWFSKLPFGQNLPIGRQAQNRRKFLSQVLKKMPVQCSTRWPCAFSSPIKKDPKEHPMWGSDWAQVLYPDSWSWNQAPDHHGAWVPSSVFLLLL